MVPSRKQTYDAVVRGLSVAAQDQMFGRRLLERDYDRETWLYQFIADELRHRSFDARPDYYYIDIAVCEPTTSLPALTIEAKFLYCHQFSAQRHKYFCNVWTDLLKRSIWNVPQQAILFVGQYTEMPPEDEMGDLYRAEWAWNSPKCAGYDFVRFEAELRRVFDDTCHICAGDDLQKPHIWHANWGKASMFMRSWLLEVKHGVSTEDLAGGLRRACATDREFDERMESCQRAWTRATKKRARLAGAR
jgi:hypothetical protein